MLDKKTILCFVDCPKVIIFATDMNCKSFYCLLTLLLACWSCAEQRNEDEEAENDLKIESYVAKGDSMIYGLACDGCTDSVLVLLPDSGGDPVNYDILNAMQERKVFGRPRIGDKMAVLVHPEKANEVLMAVNLEQVNGTWYNMVLPELHHRIRHRMDSLNTVNDEHRARVDSFLEKVMIPREYAYMLKRDYTVKTMGGPPVKTTLDGNSPVEYPPIKRYTEWHVFNGKIILSYPDFKEGSSDTEVALKNDTAEFVLLRRDTMALKFGEQVQGFKLKPDTVAKSGL